jgi:hypothetical protein
MRAWLLPLLLLAAASHAPARDRDLARDVYHPHRGEALGVVAAEVPRAIRLLPPGGPDAWPEAARSRLEARVRAEWGPGRTLGAVRPGVGIWVTYPLVAAQQDGRVLVPVLAEASLPLRGSLALPVATGPRRVIVLVDASSSANAPVLFRRPDGSAERVPVLEAERRAVRHLLEVLDRDRVEVGLIEFGEGTRPLLEPGAPLEAALERLARTRRERPRGEGRTDTVCALRLASEWLDDAPAGYEREIVLLTDGDFPHSGRFQRCDALRSDAARTACRARSNTTGCPARHRFQRRDGESDLVQMASFARSARRRLRVHTLVFETDRGARPYRELAEQTHGAFVRVPSAAALESALPALVGQRIESVVATNLDTGEVVGDLWDADTALFEGRIGLRPGSNDVELRIDGERGTAGLYRYRVWHEPGFLRGYLSEIRGRNHDLDERLGELIERTRTEVRPPARRVEVEIDPASSAARD